MADKIFVEHSGQHEPTSKQLRDAGVDLDKVSGYVNESGVGTTYAFEDETPAKKSARGTDQAQPS